MQDLKDEGNDLFKEGDFDNSWMHYRNALFIARILELRFYHIVDKEFKSTLFSNRAFCCLKKVWWHQTNENLHFFFFSPSMLSTISTLCTWGLFIYLFFTIPGNVYRSYKGLWIRYQKSSFRKNVEWLTVWHILNFGFVVTALQIFPGNIKAYYRQVLALKAQNRLTDALSVAEQGMEIKPGVSFVYLYSNQGMIETVAQ